MQEKWVFASGNHGKLIEVAASLAGHAIELVPQASLGVCEAVEDGKTFVDNALLKAEHALHLTGLPVLADDSGLEIDALGGAPGIYSARFSGHHKDFERHIAKVHQLLRAKKITSPLKARFHCALVLLFPVGHQRAVVSPLIFSGVWQGSIVMHARGKGGFGYDPIFYDPVYQCTAAELSLARKNQCSHRAKALTKLKTWLQTVRV
jgi:XTP/dITP diphosphohydrolase